MTSSKTSFQPLLLRFFLILPLTILPAVDLFGQIQAGAHYDIYFLAGQSNATGRGDATELPGIAGGIYAQPQTDVQFYYRSTLTNNSGSINTDLVEDQFVPLQAGSGHGFNNPSSHTTEFGPELAMGRALADASPGRNIAIIKYSHGGSNLHTHWSGDSAAAGSNDRYADFLSVVRDALGDITSAGATFQLEGLAWVQGESDVSNANAYEANLTDLISRMRTDVFAGQPAQFVVSRLSSNQYNSLSSQVTTVRAAQVAVADADENVSWVDSDAPEFSTYNINNPIHFDAQGAISLGAAIGSAFDVPVLLGDVNLDGTVSFLDIAPFIAILSADGFQVEADINEDTVVNFLDIAPFIAILAGP